MSALDKVPTPEHDKLKVVKAKSQAIGEFIEWLGSQEVRLARYDLDLGILVDDMMPIEKRLAAYFGIDLAKLEAEKLALLAAVRSLG